MIEVLPYNTDWPKQYESEVKILNSILDEEIISIEHIGSTSIPGCFAKPIIDILIVLPSIQNQDQITHKLEAINYTRLYYDFFMRLFFCKKTNPAFQLHVFPNGYSEIDRFLKFKSWLNQHPNDMQDYINLKKLLAVKHANSLEKYSLAKEEFVSNIEVRSGWSGIKLVTPYTQEEINIIAKAKSKITIDPNLHSKSFIVKKGNNDIGCVFILRKNNKEAVIKLLTICEDFNLSDVQQQIISDLKIWLKYQEVQTIHIEPN